MRYLEIEVQIPVTMIKSLKLEADSPKIAKSLCDFSDLSSLNGKKDVKIKHYNRSRICCLEYHLTAVDLPS